MIFEISSKFNFSQCAPGYLKIQQLQIRLQNHEVKFSLLELTMLDDTAGSTLFKVRNKCNPGFLIWGKSGLLGHWISPKPSSNIISDYWPNFLGKHSFWTLRIMESPTWSSALYCFTLQPTLVIHTNVLANKAGFP